MNELASIIKASKRIVFFGGAGVSTESGIPDFRSVDGLYHQKYDYPPETILSRTFFELRPAEFYKFYKDKMLPLDAKPNDAHKKLFELEQMGKLTGIVTQNIDGLHQKAGSVNVQEIHGTTWRNHCTVCGAAYGVDFIFDGTGKPKCLKCGGMVRPDVTLYGEFLPKEAHDNARRMIREADLLIIGGTSLQVGSAAGLARLFSGGHLVIINKSKTLMDGEADLVFHDSIGKVLTAVSSD
jgi:NAD-dependent deacetylase